MFYGAEVWDPWLIILQIARLQCLYYISLGLFLSILVGSRVPRMSLIYFFDYVTLTTSTATGWCVIASSLFSAIAGAGFLFYLVKRAKKCLDFAATIYILHLFKCIMYGGWPSSMTWWVVNGTGLAVMTLLGEWLCSRRELHDIQITRLRPNSEKEEKGYLYIISIWKGMVIFLKRWIIPTRFPSINESATQLPPMSATIDREVF